MSVLSGFLSVLDCWTNFRKDGANPYSDRHLTQPLPKACTLDHDTTSEDGPSDPVGKASSYADVTEDKEFKWPLFGEFLLKARSLSTNTLWQVLHAASKSSMMLTAPDKDLLMAAASIDPQPHSQAIAGENHEKINKWTELDILSPEHVEEVNIEVGLYLMPALSEASHKSSSVTLSKPRRCDRKHKNSISNSISDDSADNTSSPIEKPQQKVTSPCTIPIEPSSQARIPLSNRSPILSPSSKAAGATLKKPSSPSSTTLQNAKDGMNVDFEPLKYVRASGTPLLDLPPVSNEMFRPKVLIPPGKHQNYRPRSLFDLYNGEEYYGI